MAGQAGGQKRAVVQVPANRADMSPEEQRQVELEMARDPQRQLGIEPDE